MQECLSDVGSQDISCILCCLKKGCLGFACARVGIVDCMAARPMEVGFGRGSGFVLCPSDVVVKEVVVCGSRNTFELARLDAPDGLEFEGAGNRF